MVNNESLVGLKFGQCYKILYIVLLRSESLSVKENKVL